MGANWYYVKNGQQFGPFEFDLLRQLTTSGLLHANDLVWQEGSPTMVPAGSVGGLIATPAPSTTPGPATITPAIVHPAEGPTATSQQSSEIPKIYKVLGGLLSGLVVLLVLFLARLAVRAIPKWLKSSPKAKTTSLLDSGTSKSVLLDKDQMKGFWSRNQGKAALDKGEWDAAIENFTAAIKDNPQRADSLKYRGDAYVGKQDYPAAIADYSRAIELNPKFSAAFQARGKAYELHGDPEKAQADRRQAAALQGQ